MRLAHGNLKSEIVNYFCKEIYIINKETFIFSLLKY